MKLELKEVNVILSIIENTQFQGKDIPVMSTIISKLQAESVKLQKE